MQSFARSHTGGGRERAIPEPTTGGAAGEDEFRVDVERIRFSPYFSRLSAVTQVIPQAGSGTTVHNRLTHSLKVSAVARSIAVGFRDAPDAARQIVADLGGCDPVVVQAAAAAHDLGHPPFGHLGEQVLDRVARTRLGLPDGFEGNAQTFRILTALDSCDATARGLNLTKAVRAAVLKYPWTRNEWRSLPPQPAERLPRGVGSDSASGALKFSAYSIDALEMADVLSAFPAIGRHQQTLECSVMDIADDIAYSVHDLDDFYRAGVLQFTSVSAELNGWLQAQSALAALEHRRTHGRRRAPPPRLRARGGLAAHLREGLLDRQRRGVPRLGRARHVRPRRGTAHDPLRRRPRGRPRRLGLHPALDRPPQGLDPGGAHAERPQRTRAPRQ